MARLINNTSTPCLENTTNVPQVPFTVSLWATQPTDDAAKNYLWGVGWSSQTNRYAYVTFDMETAGNPAGIYHRGLTSTAAQTGNAVQTGGTWNHMFGIFASASDRTLVLNGDTANKATSTATVSNVPTYTNETCGCVRTGGGYLGTAAGAVAELGVWNVALTEAEGLMLYNGVSPLFIRPSALIHYRPLHGRLDPEPNLMNSSAGMSNTSTTYAEHPRMNYPSAQILQFPPGAGAPPAGSYTIYENYYRQLMAGSSNV